MALSKSLHDLKCDHANKDDDHENNHQLFGVLGLLIPFRMIFESQTIHIFSLFCAGPNNFKMLPLKVSNFSQKLFGFVVHKFLTA